MSSTILRLEKRGLIRPPSWLGVNTAYESVMGSVAHGVSDDLSDYDITGFAIPPKHVVFPHTEGEIMDFGTQKKRFKVYQQHHVTHPDESYWNRDKTEKVNRVYDLNIYSIIWYFHLCLDNNPNMLDSLFSPRDCVLTSTPIAELVRENRRNFLHRGSWHRYKGYAYSQLHKMKGKNVEEGSKRAAIRERYGYDVKFAAHTVRLLYGAEMILTEGDIDMRRHKEHIKAIRRGEVEQDEIIRWVAEKEAALERVYEECKLPDRKESLEPQIKELLLNCLEMHYGSLSNVVARTGASDAAMSTIAAIVDQWRQTL